MNKSGYYIILVSLETGVVLDENGESYLKGNPRFQPTFDTMKSALTAKNELLQKYIYAEVTIVNSDTKEFSEVFRNEKEGEIYFEEKAAYNKWRSSLFSRIFRKVPILKFYKPRSREY